ncbi:MAG TPA: hypothetical protein VHB18_01180 [Mycobacteriales bacterium]|nr:hypothetical protein [Mycobacteriales bacterium]
MFGNRAPRIAAAALTSLSLAGSAISGAPPAGATTNTVDFGVNTPALNDPHHAGGPFAPKDVAAAATDLQPGSILRITISWFRVQPQCLTAAGTDAGTRALCQTPGPIQWDRAADGTIGGGLKSDLDAIKDKLEQGTVRLLPMIYRAPRWAWGRADVQDPDVTDPHLKSLTTDVSNLNKDNAGTTLNDDVTATLKDPTGLVPDDSLATMPPGDDTQALGWWRHFAQATVQFLESNYGPNSVVGLEVWNEPNIKKFWSVEASTDAKASQRYANVLCYAFQGARAADPQLPIIYAGLAGGGTALNDPNTPNNQDAANFLAGSYAARSSGPDIRHCMTSVGIHPYNNIAGHGFYPPDPADGVDSPLETVMSDLGRVTAANGDANRHVSITEFGYWPGSKSPWLNPDGTHKPVTTQEQAAWDAQAYDVVKNLPNLDMFLIYSLYDSVWAICPHPNGPPEDNPAATALKQAISGYPSALAACGSERAS